VEHDPSTWAVSRRRFIRLALITVGGAATTLAAACQPAAPAAPTAQSAASTQAPAAPAPTAAPKPAAAPTAQPTIQTGVVAAPTAAPTVAPAANIKRGGRLIFAEQSDWLNLHPWIGAGPNELGKEQFYDALVEFDRQFNRVPSLAESWSLPDELTYVFKLRQGVKFHNGKEMDAGDVVYSMGLMRDKEKGAFSWYTLVDAVTALDKYTVQIKTTKPDLALLGTFAMHRFAAIVPDGAWEKQDLLTSEAGTGPYQLVEYAPTDHITMRRFPDHWRKNLPIVDEIILKLMPDEDARIAALRSGAVDLAYLSPDGARRVAREPNLQVFEGFVCSPRVFQFAIKGEGKPLDDSRVRRALSLAFDRREILEKVHDNKGILTGPIPSKYGDWSIPQDELEQKWFKYDVAEARKLLSDAGYANGFSLNAVVFPNADAPRRSVILKEQWNKIGVELKIEQVEFGVAVARLGEGDFDVFPTGRGMRNDPDGFVVDFTHLRAPGDKRGGLWGFQNQPLSELIEKARLTTDNAQRHQMYLEIQRMILQESPHLYEVLPLEFVGAQKYVKDYWVDFGTFRPALKYTWLDK
jgi:peptide/nickel transport system substrate-binding protein